MKRLNSNPDPDPPMKKKYDQCDARKMSDLDPKTVNNCATIVENRSNFGS
jgi:hypothetical protein